MQSLREQDRSLKIVITVAFVCVLAIWILYPIVIAYLPNPYSGVSWQNRGTFGDSFGALNTLFSGLAFGALVATLLLQARSVNLQHEELIRTREEFEKSVVTQTISAKLSALTILVSDCNILLDHFVKSGVPKNASDNIIQRFNREEELWFEKRRLLLKEISRLVTALPNQGEESHWTRVLEVENEISTISGGNRPLGPDFDEK